MLINNNCWDFALCAKLLIHKSNPAQFNVVN